MNSLNGWILNYIRIKFNKGGKSHEHLSTMYRVYLGRKDEIAISLSLCSYIIETWEKTCVKMQWKKEEAAIDLEKHKTLENGEIVSHSAH